MYQYVSKLIIREKVNGNKKWQKVANKKFNNGYSNFLVFFQSSIYIYFNNKTNKHTQKKEKKIREENE